MHYSIILNPTAGNGYAKTIWPAIQATLDKHGALYDYQITKYRQHAEYLAQKIAKENNNQVEPLTVIVIGGDGTLFETLNGLIKGKKDDPLPLSFIPAGNRNDFARGYGISLEPTKALLQILNADGNRLVSIGHVHDSIKNQDSYFLNNLGIGFDAAVTSQINNLPPKRSPKRHLPGKFTYFRQALGVLYNQQPFYLMVQDDHGREYFPKAYIVSINNHPFIGGRFKIAPEAKIEEPTLDIVIAERKSWLTTFWQLFQLNRGRLASSHFASHFHTKHFHCTTTSLEFGQIDGEEMGNRFMDLTLSTSQYPFNQRPE